MGNYRGYFRSLETDNLYSVRFITDSASTGYTEIQLDGNSPFVVNYNESSTPFDPVRTSTATIKVVHNNYLEDIYSPYAHGTQVILHNDTTDTDEWVGFLVPKIYNQGYEDCLEEIDIEAADCISSLQYFDYEPIGTEKAIVTVKSILNTLCNKCELLDGYSWSRSKKVGTAVVLPEHLMISEQNFFTSDTDEGWKMDEVLEEICRYFGMTAIQWKRRLYFLDFEVLSSNEDVYMSTYLKGNNYMDDSTSHVGTPFTITEDTYRGSGADISFEPIYNKVTVRDNFYTADDIVPDIFEDYYLVNRINPCNFYKEHEVSAETSSDSGCTYFQRPYNHKYWESQYLNTSGTPVTLSRQVQASTACPRDYAGATIMDLGVVKNPYKSSSDIRYQTIVSNSKDTTRYICMSKKGLAYNYLRVIGETSPDYIFRLKPGFHSVCPFSEYAYLVIDYTIVYERYGERGYINPDWDVYSGSTSNSSSGALNFRVTIGDKFWYYYNPITHVMPSQWTSTADTAYNTSSVFAVLSQWPDGKDVGKTQTDYSALNQVSWEDELGVSGYKIPLSGVSMIDEIKIEIFLPSSIFHTSQSNNQYCWVKDLKFQIAEFGQANENADNNDVIYENVIDQDAVNELNEITVKLTTKPDYAKPAYSNTVYYRNGSAVMLEAIKEDALGGIAQKPEENIIEKYVKQYSTPTKKIQATQVLSGIEPFTKIYGADVDNPEDAYVVLGGTIDYRDERQTITMLQLK